MNTLPPNKILELNQVIKLLQAGKIGVIPTDTIYGIVGSALSPQVVEKIYQLRKRSKDKPMIILVSSLKDLNQFNVLLTGREKKFLKKNWPNPLSVVLPCRDEKFQYLHRGTNSLAFRQPDNKKLLQILRATGPLVAPSANFEGEKSAEKITEAKGYFGDKVSFYLDGGEIKSTPSTLIKFVGDSIQILRQGTFNQLV